MQEVENVISTPSMPAIYIHTTVLTANSKFQTQPTSGRHAIKTECSLSLEVKCQISVSVATVL
jgi:hypothetical protein